MSNCKPRPYKELVNVMMSKRKYIVDEPCESNKTTEVKMLWRDNKFGARVNACTLMWISIFITNRPVIYIFKNMTIDIQKTRYNTPTKVYTDNIQFIKKVFDNFNTEIKLWCTENECEHLKKYNFPLALKHMDEFDANSTDIYACLANNQDLTKLNELFIKHAEINKKLIDITILFDDCEFGDIISTQFEPMLSKIYKNVCNVYILQKHHEMYRVL